LCYHHTSLNNNIDVFEDNLILNCYLSCDTRETYTNIYLIISLNNNYDFEENSMA